MQAVLCHWGLCKLSSWLSGKIFCNFNLGVKNKKGMENQCNIGPRKQGDQKQNSDILNDRYTKITANMGMLDQLQNLSRWLWEYESSSQLPAEITPSAQANETWSRRVASSKCRRASRRWTQIRIKTWPLKPRPPPHSEGFPCYHGERGEARASHCWAPSSGVSRTPSQRSDVTVGAAGRGHQSAACHPLTSANTGTNWDGGRRRKRGLHLIHLLNAPAGPTLQIRTQWRTCLFLMPEAAGGQQQRHPGVLYTLACLPLVVRFDTLKMFKRSSFISITSSK